MISRSILLTLFCLYLTSVASAVVLFDGREGSSPADQGWAYFTNPLLGADATREFVGDALRLDTTVDISEQAGYFSKIPVLFEHPRMPNLDLAIGPIDISFTLRQMEGIDFADSDPDASGERNRGGFAVIAIGEDLGGIELQFQHDRIISLDNSSTAFPVGEQVAFDTSRWTTFELQLESDGYRVVVEDEVLVSGSLRDYSDIAPSPPFGFPYQTPSFLFFGDNTGRAGAITELRDFTVMLEGDCDDNGVFEQSDLNCVGTTEERDVVLGALDLRLGDLNSDGAVNFADFLILSANFSQTGKGYGEGNLDLDGMGEVAFTDFLLFSANFGFETISDSNSNSAIQNVPEPSSLVVCCELFLLCMCGDRTRLRHRHLKAKFGGNKWKTNP